MEKLGDTIANPAIPYQCGIRCACDEAHVGAPE